MRVARPVQCSCFTLLLGFFAAQADGSSGWSPPIHESTLEHLTAAYRHLYRGEVPAALAHTDAILMPRLVKVAVAAPGASSVEAASYAQVAREAVAAWEAAAGPELRFHWASPTESDVTLTFRPSVRLDGVEVAGRAVWRRRVVSWGASQFDYALSASIEVRTRLHGRRLAPSVIRHALLHEVGHILGLADSPIRGHAMGPVDPKAPVVEPALAEVSALRALREEARSIQHALLLSHSGRTTGL